MPDRTMVKTARAGVLSLFRLAVVQRTPIALSSDPPDAPEAGSEIIFQDRLLDAQKAALERQQKQINVRKKQIEAEKARQAAARKQKELTALRSTNPA